MRTIRTLFGCCLALAAAVSTGAAFAEDDTEGVALVSHCVDGGCDDNYCDSRDSGCCDDGCSRCGQGHRCHLFGHRSDRCGNSGCPHCNYCQECNGDGCKKCRRGRLKRLFCGPHYSAGHGYVMPVKRPIWDVAYPYHAMLNATAMGMANGQQSSSAYGNVYMPTDTTQLGYSYGHVPYWMPRANMIPPTPHPEAYHHRICLPGYRDQHCQTGYDGMAYHEGGYTTGTQLHEVVTEPTLAPIPR